MSHNSPRLSSRGTAPVKVRVLSDDSGLLSALAAAGALELSDAPAAEVTLWDAGEDAEAAVARIGEIGALDGPVLALLPNSELAKLALTEGARGVLLRNNTRANADHLLSALLAVSSGLSVMDTSLAEDFAHPAAPTPSLPEGWEPLTDREREVIELLAEGLSNKQVASRLGISEHTAKFHIGRILAKLDADTRTEAVVRALRYGMVML
jgi:DNA-binding NarL/FixJ family response regulator